MIFSGMDRCKNEKRYIDYLQRGLNTIAQPASGIMIMRFNDRRYIGSQLLRLSLYGLRNISVKR
jgi:hypothetical protein